MDKIALIVFACLTLAACATQRQTVGTGAGAVTGALVGGPVGAVVGGTVGAVATAPGTALGGHAYRCHYTDRYGYRHYHWCH